MCAYTARMLPTTAGSFHLFTAFGIRVYLHWLWFVIGVFEVQYSHRYEVKAWCLAEYLALFGIVLLHEFGHSLACKSVGGRADRIILWPLGGIAFVQPPPRPGATLWSIAAGPLVNVVLLAPTIALYRYADATGGWGSADALHFTQAVAFINAALLVFNLLPVYPLDGGQILQSLLWFVVGWAKSLRAVAVMGMVVGVAAGGWALTKGDLWIVILTVFVVSRSIQGYRVATAMAKLQARGAYIAGMPR